MRPDLRLPLLGAAAWAGGLLAALALREPTAAIVCAAALAAGALLAVRRTTGAARLTALAATLVLVAVTLVGLLRQAQVAANPVADLAARRAAVQLVGTVAADPQPAATTYGETEMVRVTATSVQAGSAIVTLRTPVLVFGDEAWRSVPLGATVRVAGRLRPAYSPEESAALVPLGPVTVVRRPGLWWRGAAAVRSSVRESVAHRPVAQRSLVPALVDGDDAEVPDALAEEFRTTGLTHLLAVSGTNLTLLVGFLLVVARWCGVRGRWLYAVATLGITGFVLLARTEPSVVRAAAMGTVGLLAMGSNGRGRALRGLGAAVLGLLLLDPALATSLGFALSVLATAGILLLGPPWRDALARWLPRWLAEAVAVPTAAQLACTPLVAAVSGQVSLAAVGANLLAEPVVGPATVLGLAGGLLGLLWDPLGRAAGTLAGWCVAWIALVAHRGAALPAAALDWGTGAAALVALTALTAAVAVLGPRLVRHRVPGIGCALLLVAVVTVRPPSPGWPPAGWVMVMCDVGQGDGLVLAAGPQTAVVVDTGPDPAPMERCLDGLGVRQVPLLVLTHFDADHVTGVGAVFAGRRVGAVWTTVLDEPEHGVRLVEDAASAAGVEPVPAPFGATVAIGTVTAQVLWPPPQLAAGTDSNSGSVVLLVRTAGLTLLLTGDLGPEASARVADEVPGLDVDVLKVPHHGSRFQDETWLTSLRAEAALVSVGADNDYGHPSRQTLDPLADAGAGIYRTDQDGSIAVVADSGRLRVVTH